MSRLTEARAAIADARHQRIEKAPCLFDAPPLILALESVETNAGEQWMDHAVEAIRRASRIHDYLTVDEVWPFVTEPVHDKKAMGAAMRRASVERIIERCRGEFRISQRPETHGRPLALWRSGVE